MLETISRVNDYGSTYAPHLNAVSPASFVAFEIAVSEDDFSLGKFGLWWHPK